VLLVCGCAGEKETAKNDFAAEQPEQQSAREMPGPDGADGPDRADRADKSTDVGAAPNAAPRFEQGGDFPIPADPPPITPSPDSMVSTPRDAVAPPPASAYPVNPLRSSGGATTGADTFGNDTMEAAPNVNSAAPRRITGFQFEPRSLDSSTTEAPPMRAMAQPREDITSAEPPREMTPMTMTPTPAATSDDEAPAAESAELPLVASDSPAAMQDENPPAAPTTSEPPPAEQENADFKVVKVFYGTDRKAIALTDAEQTPDYLRYLFPVSIALTALALLILAVRIPRRRWAFGSLAVIGGLIAGLLTWYEATSDDATNMTRVYGNERGELEFGQCEVTIPKTHVKGELETKSILRFERQNDPQRHIALQCVMSQPEAEFFENLRSRIAQSPRKEAMVFIHGYNVSFEDAARRTGQVAHDLEFQGAPIFYSWPSQAGLLQYTVDETNVVWTVPHLKQFLLDVVRRTDAESVNVIAHSMGNRALTSALRELTFELQDETRLFNQVVLAAPDIDAEIFRRDIAPAITKTAHGVTLYASSKDRALMASKRVHGYPRAGDSQPTLTVLPKIDTIDVSEVDTSLLGHSYYGGSRQILDDIGLLMREGLPASRRNLAPSVSGGLTYGMFRDRLTTTTSTATPGAIR
jgi:esterase/lipase superfamily enzyme